jgi:hypothetical protein
MGFEGNADAKSNVKDDRKSLVTFALGNYLLIFYRPCFFIISGII